MDRDDWPGWCGCGDRGDWTNWCYWVERDRGNGSDRGNRPHGFDRIYWPRRDIHRVIQGIHLECWNTYCGWNSRASAH
jgi:hypothetical protein